MTVCFDTNVLLDALLDRSHAEEALFLPDRAREGELAGVVAPTVLTNTFYVGRRTADADTARTFIRSVLSFLDVAPVSHAAAVRAVKRYPDFEAARADVLTPAELFRLIVE